MNVLLGLCLFFGITLAYDVNAGICFIGDHSCTQGKIISLYTEQKECTYVDKNACEKYNRNSYCKIDNKDKCYKPSECKVGYYKHTDDICSIGSYSHLIDIDNFGCGLPITNGGRDCGAVGYGAIYDEFGFSKQTLVFNVDSEKIDCYAAISQENCQKASPHGVCEQDKCGNWHVTKCAEGYGFYWRNESGCELGVDFNAEEGDAVCQKCLGCEYASLEKCEEENPNSVCKPTDPENPENCFNAEECKEGYFKEEQNEEICKIGIYTEIFDKDKNGCGIPAYGDIWAACFERGYYEPLLGKYPDGYVYKDLFIDEDYATEFLIQLGKEFDPRILTSIGGCDVATSKEACENLNAVCEQDKCGYWRVEKCKEGYKRYTGKLDDIVDSNKTYMCYKDEPECEYASLEECEEDKGNEHSACGVDETDGCVKPIGCKKGFVSVDDNSEICRIGTYMKLFDIDNNGCGVPGTEGSGGSSPYIECLLGGADDRPGFECLRIARGNYMSDDYSEIDSLDDWFHIISEYEGSFDTQQNCEITTERGTRKCKADACGRWIWIGAVCNEGYIYGGACPDGLKRADQNYDGTGCWKCECIYKDKTDCETDNSHSVCEMVDGCWKATKCNKWSTTCEEYCKNGKCSLIDADKNGCAEMLYCFGG